jgi:hypothetical protein
MDCLPARSSVTSEGIGWFAVGFVKRPHDAKESNTNIGRPDAAPTNDGAARPQQGIDGATRPQQVREK